MKTETDSFFFFNDRYLSRESSYCLDFLEICPPRPKEHFMFIEHNFLRLTDFLIYFLKCTEGFQEFQKYREVTYLNRRFSIIPE